MRKVTDPTGLLILWIKIHGRVAPKFHSVFRGRPEVEELVYYRMETLEQAFAASPKLNEVLERARELEPSVRQRLDSPGWPRENSEQILPLPGDAGSTRSPGKRREHYRTGEEAELRHIARQHKWWD